MAGTYVREALGLTDTKILYYTDLKVTFFRIHKGPSDYLQWVANRLKVIRKKTLPDDWSWIPTDKNPADLGSRGVILTYLKNSSLLSKGPEFLVDKYYDFDKYKKENLVLQMTEGETDRKERKIVVGTFSQSGLSTYLPTFHYLHMTTLVFSGSTVGNGHLDQHSHYIEFTDTTNDSHDPSELATVEKGK